MNPVALVKKFFASDGFTPHGHCLFWNPFGLMPATSHPRNNEVTGREQAAAELLESKCFLQSTLDALSAHIGILDEEGRIVAVNEAWSRFALADGVSGDGCGVGANYLEICERASGNCPAEASAVARGIREVIARRIPEFQLEYPCHSAEENRWFVARVTRFHGEGPVKVVVAHALPSPK